MIDRGPYRSTALAVLPTHREVVRCGWCAWSVVGSSYSCEGTPYGKGDREKLNRGGDCPYYRDSFMTRLLRRFGMRSPALVRVTEREDDPDSTSPRNGGSGHRGGNVGGGGALSSKEMWQAVKSARLAIAEHERAKIAGSGGHQPRPTDAPKSPPQGSCAVPPKQEPWTGSPRPDARESPLPPAPSPRKW